MRVSLLELGVDDPDFDGQGRYLDAARVMDASLGELLSDWTYYPSELSPTIVGPTVYQANDDGSRLAIRADTPCMAEAAEYLMELPARGTAIFTIGIPEDLGPSVDFEVYGPVGFSHSYDQGSHYLSASVMGASWSLMNAGTWLWPGWHTIHITWDSVGRRREMFLDGSMLSDYNAGEYLPTNAPFRLSSYFENANAGVGRISIARAMVFDTKWSHDSILIDVDNERRSLTRPPLTSFLPLFPDLTVRWTEPADQVTAWILKFADVDGAVREFKFSADVHQMRFLDYFDEEPAGGTVHLHAVNDHGISAPAQLEF